MPKRPRAGTFASLSKYFLLSCHAGAEKAPRVSTDCMTHDEIAVDQEGVVGLEVGVVGAVLAIVNAYFSASIKKL